MANTSESKRRDGVVASLLSMSHTLGREDLRLAILGEGNTSARIDDSLFYVKASGSSLGMLSADDIVECRMDLLLSMVGGNGPTDGTVQEILMASRVHPAAKRPSVEAIFHAYFLSLPDISYVGHTHATAVVSILCSTRAREFAENRLFPDEIVCCGPASVLVPYTDPGLLLAREIRARTENYMGRYGRPPRVVLLENHGIIALGRTPEAVVAATLTAEKAAQIWIGAATLGGPRVLTAQEVRTIADRGDEHHRQRVLNL